ncbi:uncharacterized protein LOC135492090 [Lineus longissimus]|uniref:uncharacterized protein LOC135492090 n=1 Tax=Lineus longissimus TaxID=88925 RepID=UPI00315C5C22
MGASASKEEHATDIFNSILEGHEDISNLNGQLDFLEYENLVFEGGGAKGVSYCGAVRALEDVGLLKNFKRFAGTSVGSITAMILAVGGSSADGLAEALYDFQHLLQDSSRLVMPINICRYFGWHNGDRIMKHLYDRVEHLSGNRHLTFEGLYKMRGIELCVVVTNLSSCSEEYFHPKTTPDLPIALAVRMSISIPVLFKPQIRHDNMRQERHVYVDGGLCNNYPLAAFDGWFLSMNKEDSFFHMIGSKVPRFGTINNKTLGLLVFDAHESETDEDVYLKRYRDKMPERPKTHLAVRNGKAVDKKMEKLLRRYKTMDAAKNFLDLLSKCDLDRSGTISLIEFKQAIEKVKTGQVSSEEWELLFGVNPSQMDPEQLFRDIDVNSDNEISFNEFLAFMAKKGVPLREMMIEGVPHMDIQSVGSFFASLLETNMFVMKKLLAKPGDSDRSIGIYTDYVGTVDFAMQMEDKAYLVKHGWLAAVAFLREKLKSKGKVAGGSASDSYTVKCA